MTCYDLHTHSTASDGSLTPEALIARAIEHDVDVLALTDHDGTEGIDAATIAAKGTDLDLIAGVELSVTWGSKTVHIVGLDIDINNQQLQQGLAKLRDYRVGRAEEIAKRLAKAGIEGALDGARKYASDVMLGRLHFAQFLVEQGLAKDNNDVFKRYLVRNKPGYVPGKWASLEDAMTWINAAGGQAVIAHPARYKLGKNLLNELLLEFRALGGSGIEVITGSHTPEQSLIFAHHANRMNLLASCGSDFHGPKESYFDFLK